MKAENVPFVVAPFEADAQLAYMSRTKIVNAVLSRDGDMLVLHKCQIVLSKVDWWSKDFHELTHTAIKNGTTFKDLGGEVARVHEKMVIVCIIAGCDHLPSVPGIGLATAIKLTVRCKTITKVKDISIHSICCTCPNKQRIRGFQNKCYPERRWCNVGRTQGGRMSRRTILNHSGKRCRRTITIMFTVRKRSVWSPSPLQHLQNWS